MAVKYIIKEKNYLDTFLGKVFSNIAKGIRSKAIEDLKKKDPEFKKAHDKGQKAIDDMRKMMKDAGLPTYGL
jgi:prefoldin subunit 5